MQNNLALVGITQVFVSGVDTLAFLPWLHSQLFLFDIQVHFPVPLHYLRA